MSTKKIFTFALVLVLCVGMFAACSGGAGSSAPAAAPAGTEAAPAAPAAPEAPAATEAAPAGPVPLKLCKSTNGWGGNSNDPVLMEAYLTALEEATNTEIEMIAPVHAEYRDLLNVMLQSGDIPDLYRVSLAMDIVPNYAVRGYLAPIDEYVANNADIQANLGDLDLSSFTVDGQLYAIPEQRPQVKIFLTRQDLAEKYGMDMKPEMTLDEFVAEYSKVNQDEVMPFDFSKFVENFSIFYLPFGAYNGLVPDADGKWSDGFNTQEMKDAISWIKTQYDAGLLNQEFLTEENAMLRERFYSGNTVGMFDYYQNYIQMLMQSDGVDKFTDVIPTYTLTGPGGKYGNRNEGFSDAFGISPNTEYPQQAVDLIGYMCYTAEGALLGKLGVEGSHYNIEDGILVPTAAAMDSGYNASPGGAITIIPDPGELPFKWGGVGDEYFPKQLELRDGAVAENHIGVKYVPAAGVSDLWDQNAASYRSTMDEISTGIIMGTYSLDDGFAQYQAWWDSIMGDDMLAELNA